MTPHNRRVVKTICASLFVLVLAGVTYQGVATAFERRSYRYPGRLVPVGDHQLHVSCLGAGAPTVVLEAPALGFSASWAIVQPALAKISRVCAYDRAGLGWSEASDEPRELTAVPDELHTLLDGAGEAGPFVLVGDGLGAAFITLFAARFPQDTAAVVLVQSSDTGSTSEAPSPWLARTGVLRLSQSLLGASTGLPGPPGGPIAAFSTRPDHLARAAQELRQRTMLLGRAGATPIEASIPVRQLEAAGEGDMLASERTAQPLVSAITETVEAWRASHP